MDKHQEQRRHNKKIDEQNKQNRDLQQRGKQRQYSHGSRLDRCYAEENEMVASNCQMQRNKAVKILPREPMKEPRKGATETVSMKSNNDSNKDFSQNIDNRTTTPFESRNSSSEIQNSQSYSKIESYNNLSECKNKQDVKYELNKNTHDHYLDNSHINVLKNSTETNYCISSAKSEKYVPDHSDLACEDNIFSNLRLIDLLYYNGNLMQHEELLNYALALRKRISDRLSEFENPERDELAFLCALTDGSQTEKNQKLIITRIYNLIAAIGKKASEKSKISHTCSNGPEPQAQNSDFISRTNEQPKYDKGHAILNKSSEPHDMKVAANKENQNNLNTVNPQNNSVGSLTSNTWEERNFIKEELENSSMANVGTIENVSDNASSNHEKNAYRHFELGNLLNYNIDVMDGYSLINYAYALKQRILENILEFENYERETLEFLCELTDGTQSEVNQRIITMRMCHFVRDFFESDQNSSTEYSKCTN